MPGGLRSQPHKTWCGQHSCSSACQRALLAGFHILGSVLALFTGFGDLAKVTEVLPAGQWCVHSGHACSERLTHFVQCTFPGAVYLLSYLRMVGRRFHQRKGVYSLKRHYSCIGAAL